MGARGGGDLLLARREKKLFLSSKVSKIRATPAGDRPQKRRRSAEEEEEETLDRELQAITREVLDLGATQFKRKKQKRAYEERKIISLGGQASKPDKVPYNILMGMKKKQKERELKRTELDKERGMFVAKKKKENKGSDLKSYLNQMRGNRRGDGGAGSGERGLKCSKGVFKDGVLYVKPPPGTTERQDANNNKKKRSFWRKKPTKR